MNQQASLQATLLNPGEGTWLQAFGDELIFHLTGEQTGGQCCLFTDITPPGGGPPPHYHLNEDEWFNVQEGRVSFFAHGQWRELGPGGIAFVPKGLVHTFKNTGTVNSRMLVTTSPAGFEVFMKRCADEFNRDGGPDMSKIPGIAAEHGIHFVQD